MRGAIIINRVDGLYLQWYDKLTKKIYKKKLNLPDTKEGRKVAEKTRTDFIYSLRAEQNKVIESKKVITIERAWAEFLKFNSKNEKTIKTYNWFYNIFCQFYDKNDSCFSINRNNIEDLLVKINLREWKQNTKHDFYIRVKQFLMHLFDYKYTDYFRINKNLRYKPEIVEKIIFTKEDIKKMIEGLTIKNNNFRSLFYLLLLTGLRPTDILNIKELDKKNLILKYYSPKSKLFKEIPIKKEVAENYIELNYKNEHAVTRAIKRFMVQAGLDKYTPRTFRKTFVSFAKNIFKMDLEIVDELIGHKQGKVSGVYYRKFGIEVLRKELSKFKIL